MKPTVSILVFFYIFDACRGSNLRPVSTRLAPLFEEDDEFGATGIDLIDELLEKQREQRRSSPVLVSPKLPGGRDGSLLSMSSGSSGSIEEASKSSELEDDMSVGKPRSTSVSVASKTGFEGGRERRSASAGARPSFLKSFFRGKAQPQPPVEDAVANMKIVRPISRRSLERVEKKEFTDSSSDGESGEDSDLRPGSDREPITSIYSGDSKSPVPYCGEDSVALSESLNRSNEQVVKAASTPVLVQRKGRPIENMVRRRFSRSKERSAKTSVPLPLLMNPEMFGSNEIYDAIFAGALYRNGEQFEPLSRTEHSMLTGLMPLSRSALDRSLMSDGIHVDVMSPGVISMMRTLHDLTDHRGHEDFDPDMVRESIVRMVAYSIGKASTHSADDIDDLAECPQRVLITPRDIFYYPEMLKVCGLFVSMFDNSRSNEFFHQFISTFYSGVFGPRRADLFFITRMQMIPSEVITDRMILQSLNSPEMINSGYIRDQTVTDDQIELANSNIKSRRMYYLEPTNRDSIRFFHDKEKTRYTELDPVPKTLDDVLELSLALLEIDKTKNHKNWKFPPSESQLRTAIYEPKNIKVLQSFFLNVLSPLEVKGLLEHFIFSLGKDPYLAEYRNHTASFLYAAYIKALQLNDVELVPLVQLKTLMNELFSMRISLDRIIVDIHQTSINCAEIDTMAPFSPLSFQEASTKPQMKASARPASSRF
jgi:hypothetical protein